MGNRDAVRWRGRSEGQSDRETESHLGYFAFSSPQCCSEAQSPPLVQSTIEPQGHLQSMFGHALQIVHAWNLRIYIVWRLVDTLWNDSLAT